jgi:glutaminyl-tRNA synthetase
MLVKEGHVAGWDDPRMPTLSGLRRRGYTPESIINFCDRIGFAKRNSTVDMALLEHCLRDGLNKTAPRYMAVLDPLKIVIENYPEGQTEELDAINNPEDESMGRRKVPFSKEIYIERDDFMEDPPKKFFRLAPGREVRLRYAYFITCTDVVKDEESGLITELRCTYDPETRGGDSPDGRKVKATLHWVSVKESLDAEVRLYDHLFSEAEPGDNFIEQINPGSLKSMNFCRIEPALVDAHTCQFERLGYFCLDPHETFMKKKPVFNRAVTLKDSWAKIKKAGKKK